MKNAIILGCSHAAGSEMSLEPGLSKHDYLQAAEYEATHSFAWLIAKDLGYEPQNHAIPGGSNQAIFRIFHQLESQLDCQDLIIACWTGIDRSELYHTSTSSWRQITHNCINTNHIRSDTWLKQGCPIPGHIDDLNLVDAHRYFVLYMLTLEHGQLDKQRNIMALNHLADKRKIPVINLDMFWPVPISMDQTWPINDQTFYDWGLERNEPHTPSGHFFAPTHRRFADYVLSHLTSQN